MRAVDRWVRTAFSGFFRGFERFRFDSESCPTHLPLTRAVGRREKYREFALWLCRIAPVSSAHTAPPLII
jgi:hypothetical protein